MRRRLLAILRRRRAVVVLQLAFVALVLGVLGWVLRDVAADAIPRLRNADLAEVGIALAVLAAYYLLFVLGWRWILAALGVRVGYALALQAEMASMLAKYVPGLVWTPLARILWLRRAGVGRSGVVFGSIALEAGLSAISGVLVFALGLAWVDGGRATLVPLAAFACAVSVLVHPRVYGWLARRVVARVGAEPPPPLPYRTMAALLAFYSGTWLVGGVALLFLARSLGGDPGWSAVPFLGGTAAVGAIVAVLSVFAPSGLGVREGSMYALMLAVATEAVALGVTVLNRLAITLVEAVLLLVGVVAWRLAARPTALEPLEPLESWPEPDLARRSP